MGAILARLRRSESIEDLLASIKQESDLLEKSKAEVHSLRNKFITRLTLYSLALYPLLVCILFWFIPVSLNLWKWRLFFWTPTVAYPFLIYYMRKILHWYFVRGIASQDLKIRELKKKKKTLLEEVMEKETYRRASKILDMYGETSPSPVKKPLNAEDSGAIGTPVSRPGLRQRGTSAAAVPQTPGGVPTPNPSRSNPTHPQGPTTPQLAGPRNQADGRTPMRGPSTPGPFPRMVAGGLGAPTGPPLPRSIPPRERGVFDKIVDYLVDDGPQSRYALICKSCHSHNGMALREEYEYLTFRCCYCHTLNESRKKRPVAPVLEQPIRSAPGSPSSRSVPNMAGNTHRRIGAGLRERHGSESSSVGPCSSEEDGSEGLKEASNTGSREEEEDFLAQGAQQEDGKEKAAGGHSEAVPAT